MHDDMKRMAYRVQDPGAYDYVPLSHKSYGRLGLSAMQHLSMMADVPVGSGGVQRIPLWGLP